MPTPGVAAIAARPCMGNRADAERARWSPTYGRPRRSVRNRRCRSCSRHGPIAPTSWAPTTTRQTRSVLDRYFAPTPRTTPRRRHNDIADRQHLRHTSPTRWAERPPARARHVGAGACRGPIRLAQAVRWGWVWDNPAERAHRITVATRELHPPTPTELNTLLAHVVDRDPMLHVLLVLAAPPVRDAHNCWRCGGTTSTTTRCGSRSAPAGSKAPTVPCWPPPRPNDATASTSTPTPTPFANLADDHGHG